MAAFRRSLSALAVLAIFFNAIAPFAHRAVAADPGSSVVICSALGFLVPLGNDRSSSSDAPAKVAFNYCPICAAAYFAATLPSPQVPAFPKLLRERAIVVPVEDVAFVSTLPSTLGARAPPPLV